MSTPLSLSVFGPEGLQLVQVTDVSLLVEWESVRGAEYYILTYHPKDDESSLEKVMFFFFVISMSMWNKEYSKNPHFLNTFVLTRCIPGSDSRHQELLPHHRFDSWDHLHCQGVRSDQRNPKWSRQDWGHHRWAAEAGITHALASAYSL